MISAGAPGQPQHCAPGVRIPVRRTHSDKSRHHIDAAGILHGCRQFLRLGRTFQNAQLIPQPLDHRTADKNRPFQGIVDLSVQSPGDGGHQAVFGKDRLFSRIDQQKRTGAVGVLSFSRLKAGLPEQSRLLVPCRTGNPDRSAKNGLHRLPVNTAGRLRLRQHTPRNIQKLQQFIIPVQGIDIEHHGPGSVGIVCHMDLTPGQLPDKPGFDGTEQQLSGFRLFPGPRHVFQNPAKLGAAEIGIDEKSGLLPDHFLAAPGLQFVTKLCRPPTLPHDGVIDRHARFLIPDHRGFPLVGNADGLDIRIGTVDFQQRLLGHPHLGRPDFHGVMLHPAVARINLREFLLGHADHLALLIINDASRACGALIQSHHVLSHRDPPVFFFFSYKKISIIRLAISMPFSVIRMPPASSSASPRRTNC